MSTASFWGQLGRRLQTSADRPDLPRAGRAQTRLDLGSVCVHPDQTRPDLKLLRTGLVRKETGRLFSHLCLQTFLLHLPALAVLELVLSSLFIVLAPSAFRRVRILLPFQNSTLAQYGSGQSSSAGTALPYSGHLSIWALLLHPVFLRIDPFLRPVPGFVPLLLRDLAHKVGQGSGRGHPPCPIQIPIPQPLHPPRIWLLRFLFRPLVRLLVALYSFLGWEPPYLYAHIWSGCSQGGYPPPCLHGILLSRAWLFGHKSAHSGLRIHKH